MTGAKVPVEAGSASNANDTYPIFFKVGKKSMISNGFSQDIENCIALGSARGNGNSERALVHILKLSCTDPSGKYRYEADIKSGNINAYVMGSDNLLGMPGVREDVSSPFVYKSLMAGFLQGVANAYSAVPSVVGISGEIQDGGANQFSEGFAQGTSESLGALAEYYLDLATTITGIIVLARSK